MKKLNANDFYSGKGETHSVNYHLYSSKIKSLDKFDIPRGLNKVKTVNGERCYEKSIISCRKNEICFGSLLVEIGKAKTDRFVYILKKSREPQLSTNEKVKWLDICLKVGALPEYIKSSDIKTDRYVIKLDDSLPPSLLYIYLTCIRWIQECPEFVKNMIILTDKYKINFHLAWLISSLFSVRNSYHNIVPYGYTYGKGLDLIIVNSKINVSIARGLRNFLENPTKYDERKCTKIAMNLHGFLAAENIRKASDVEEGPLNINRNQYKFNSDFLIAINKTLNPKLNKAIESESKEDLLELFNQKII